MSSTVVQENGEWKSALLEDLPAGHMKLDLPRDAPATLYELLLVDRREWVLVLRIETMDDQPDRRRLIVKRNALPAVGSVWERDHAAGASVEFFPTMTPDQIFDIMRP